MRFTIFGRATLFAAMLLAMPVSAEDAEPTMTLLQFSIAVPAGADAQARADALVAAVGAATTCRETLKVGRAHDAAVVGRLRVSPSALPDPLRGELTGRPVGTPTSVFRDGEHLRFLVQCPEVGDDIGPDGDIRIPDSFQD